MVDENQVEGTAREFMGKAQGAAGDFMGDDEMRARGKMKEGVGKAQQTFGAAAEELRDRVSEKPLAALAMVAGAAFLLGCVVRR